MGFSGKQILVLIGIVVVGCFLANRFTTYRSYDNYGNSTGTSKPGLQNPASSAKRAPKNGRNRSARPMSVAA